MRRDWLHVLVREREGVLGSARLSGACSRRARLHNKALKLARSASRVQGHSACTSRPRSGMLLAQLKAKDVMWPALDSSPRLARSLMEAVTFDFFETLIFHREGRGRGHVLMDYLDSHRLPHAPWEHGVLYDVFDGLHARYRSDPSSADRGAQQRDIAERVFQRLDVECDSADLTRHASMLWEILGPASFGVYADALRVLPLLRGKGIPTALISNWQCGLAQFCTELHLAEYFDHIVCSAELGVAKPDPAIFLDTCARLGVSPERVIHVGDTIIDDYDGARGAGLGAVLVSRATEPEVAVERWIHGLDELPQLLELETPGRGLRAP